MITTLLPLVASEVKNTQPQISPINEIVTRNVRAGCRHLYLGSTLIHQRVKGGDLHVVGATYNINTGLVAFEPVVRSTGG